MKKLLLGALAVICVFSLAACGEQAKEVSGEVAEEEISGEGEVVGIKNPLVSVTADELAAQTSLSLKTTEGLSELRYYVVDYKDESGDYSTMGEIMFIYNGKEYCYRGQSSANTDNQNPENISGMYGTYGEAVATEVGYCSAFGYIEETDNNGYLLWDDVVPGYTYSLSTSEETTVAELANVANMIFETLQGEA